MYTQRSVNKSLRTTCAGTSASVTATYYTHETTRWKISNPFNIGYSGRGGYASKSGKPQTSKSGSVYKCSQRVGFLVQIIIVLLEQDTVHIIGK